MDEMVLETQRWLNATYEGKTGWIAIPEDGHTGWTTVYALLYAFQIENGSTTPSTNIGSWTLNKLKEVGMLKEDDNAEPNNIVKILQGTLWCKGYPADGITGIFSKETAGGIKNLKLDIGLKNPDSEVTILLWYTLFSMQQFVLVSGGNSGIREFQQWFNNNYVAYYARYVPCDGLAGRELYTCFILMLQMEEGYSADAATGIFADKTFANCPTLATSLDAQKYPVTIRCIKIALWLNGFPSEGFETSSILDDATFQLIHQFNSFMLLPDTGDVITPGTIKSLYTSNGDVNRTCYACDTSKPITKERAEILIHNNIKCIGRYITPGIIDGEDKQVTLTEMNVLKQYDIALIPIYQSSGDSPSYFTEAQGKYDAKKAYSYATDLSIPGDSIIYFSVDYDLLGGDIPLTAIPYFNAIFTTLNSKGMYRTGIYGTRNVCSQVIQAGFAVSAYVSDMSTGYSGNMGFSMPHNWAFDQFYETSISYNGSSLNIDKVAKRGTDLGVYLESSQITALRKMSEDILDSFNLRPLLLNVSFEVGDKITLIKAPIKVELLAKETFSNDVSDADFKLTGHLEPNGTVTASVEKDIDNMAASFKISSSDSNSISLTLTGLVEKFPDGTDFYVKISLTNGDLVYKFIVDIPKGYIYNGDTYKGSIEVDFTFYKDYIPSGYSPAFEYALEYKREKAFASLIDTTNNLVTVITSDIKDVTIMIVNADFKDGTIENLCIMVFTVIGIVALAV